MQDTIHNFIKTAANVFKQHYGTYPERIGLDYFTRMQEYGELHFFEHYFSQEIQDLPLSAIANYATCASLTATFERVQIKIDAAIFEQVRYTPLTHMLIKPEKGHDEVICEGNGVTVFMTLWFTEKGYHVIMWNEHEKVPHLR